MPVKAILFDCFGVLVAGGLEILWETYDIQPDDIEYIRYWDHESTQGHITYDEFLTKISDSLKIDKQEIKTLLDDNPANLQLLDYIKNNLKNRYKIGFLSNAADDWLEELFEKEHLELFDDFILSFQHGLHKPDEAIFELAAKRLGVAPSECIMVDDREEYLAGARATGMQTVLYSDFANFQVDIEKLL